MFNVLDFGAIADGKTLNTQALQFAIDECSKKGGGKVIVPRGNYLTGTIWLKDNVEFHLEKGATIIASENLEDYNNLEDYQQNWQSVSENWLGKHLIIAHEISNVSITGLGEIDASGDKFFGEPRTDLPWMSGYGWREGFTLTKDPNQPRPGQVICFIECQDVVVKDITIKNATCWSCFFHGCERVLVNGIKVANPLTFANTDGVDIDCCRHVTVSDCIINTGDDALTVRCSSTKLKNYKVCEFINISNCQTKSSSSTLRVGVGKGEIRNVKVSGINVKSAGTLLRIATRYSQSCEGKIENLEISNITATDVGIPMVIDSDVGYVKNVKISNVKAECLGGCKIIERDDGLVDNIIIENLQLTVKKETRPLTPNRIAVRGEHMFTVNNAKNVTLNGVKISADQEVLHDWKGKFFSNNTKNLKKINCNI